ncbi:3',5'-cyclic-nucleotide phosphodiesterase [Betaproteobacteria bacterium SCN1]|jgi:ribonuclease BN (tRNA processing enzyme)|nr:3',5'-cyclic-nucleotide phosphodiesterase [Betaproteobacteria bacterium SCN1]MBN8759524.1 3',5'-cyclic-nucleotide phosphodiesterase [Thiobacillus sp.]ODU89752.1 MAG: 3',5'-cyclic-nucleotide phosphodiesterase [Thiobacillus sp. SCN 65-179]OJW37680.1 MAG: 3',5'-cyclic-nucleotide phosphodiesterase [Thiobacillus sp. 65-69]
MERTTRLTVLGCSGGIGSGRHTTCLMIDDDVLIDVGTGVTTLDFGQLLKIDHVFLTHAHLDHVLGLPLLLDSVGDQRTAPVTVHALPEVLDVLSAHLFNWKLWPDFREIPDKGAPWLRFEALARGETRTIGARRFQPLPAHHVVPACGYRIAASGGSLVFSGDTTHCPAFVETVNAMADLRHLVIETSFENALSDIARASRHHWPESLAAELDALKIAPQVWITHLKPGNEAAIMHELRAAVPGRELEALIQGQTIVW